MQPSLLVRTYVVVDVVYCNPFFARLAFYVTCPRDGAFVCCLSLLSRVCCCPAAKLSTPPIAPPRARGTRPYKHVVNSTTSCYMHKAVRTAQSGASVSVHARAIPHRTAASLAPLHISLRSLLTCAVSSSSLDVSAGRAPTVPSKYFSTCCVCIAARPRLMPEVDSPM